MSVSLPENGRCGGGAAGSSRSGSPIPRLVCGSGVAGGWSRFGTGIRSPIPSIVRAPPCGGLSSPIPSIVRLPTACSLPAAAKRGSAPAPSPRAVSGSCKRSAVGAPTPRSVVGASPKLEPCPAGDCCGTPLRRGAGPGTCASPWASGSTVPAVTAGIEPPMSVRFLGSVMATSCSGGERRALTVVSVLAPTPRREAM